MTVSEFRATVQNAAHKKSRAIHEHFMLQCEAHKLPKPRPEWKFNPDRKWRFDFAWITLGIALEIEGAIWTNGGHSRGSGRVRDMEKFNAAALSGWRVFHFTPDQIKSGEAVEFMKKALKK